MCFFQWNIMLYNINHLSLHCVFHGIRFKVNKDWLSGIDSLLFFVPFSPITSSPIQWKYYICIYYQLSTRKRNTNLKSHEYKSSFDYYELPAILLPLIISSANVNAFISFSPAYLSDTAHNPNADPCICISWTISAATSLRSYPHCLISKHRSDTLCHHCPKNT